MTQKLSKIAIIGAGLAGATLAQRLTQAGVEVSVYEKSRGTGGRLSSCRLPGSTADLGAPFLKAKSNDFSQWLSQQDCLQTWHPQTIDFQLQPSVADALYVGESRLSSLTRQLLKDVTLYSSTRVGYIWPEQQGALTQVRLRDEKGESLGVFDAVIVTAPAQQAAALLEAIPRFAKKAASIQPQASWVNIIETKASTKTPDLIMGKHPIFYRCVKESSKPGRQAEQGTDTWALEACTEWSEEHVNTVPEVVATKLNNAFKQLISDAEVVATYRTHRWLYSRHNRPENEVLWDQSAHIGACGDWLSSGGFEGAWQSANKLADILLSEVKASQN